MDDLGMICVKAALKTLAAAGGAGLKKADVLSILSRAHGTPLFNDEQEELFELLVSRGWIADYVESVWHNRRWRITERGMTALEGM